MIKDLKIQMVDHPCPDQIKPKYNKPYVAITWQGEGYTSAVAMEWAEDTLKQHSELTNLEYLELLSMIVEYKKACQVDK